MTAGSGCCSWTILVRIKVELEMSDHPVDQPHNGLAVGLGLGGSLDGLKLVEAQEIIEFSGWLLRQQLIVKLHDVGACLQGLWEGHIVSEGIQSKLVLGHPFSLGYH